ncbi:MAG: papain-like cysteine peptidase [bacterium]|nr:papain-like cysteine peptidase [bacterium]
MIKTLDLPLFKNKYDCIFSLGLACYNAEMLTKAKLRVFSSPFDWLGCSTITTRLSFLCNDFDCFFFFYCLKKTGVTEYPEECDVYTDEKTGIVFKHDFPKGLELAEGYEIVNANFDRKIKRLLKKLKDTKHSLMVYMCYKDEKIPYEEIVELMKQINEHFGKTTIDIAIVEHNQELKANELNIENISENVYKIEVFNLLEDGAIGNYDACKPFLSKIKLKKSFKDYLFKVSKGRKRMRVYLFGIKILSFQYHN